MQSFWDRVFAGEEYRYGTSPNEWIRTAMRQWVVPGLSDADHRTERKPTAIDLASGEGRNAVWLASQGFHTLAIDGSETALRKAQKLADERGLDLQTRHADIIQSYWRDQSWQEPADLVVSSFFHTLPEDRECLLGVHADLVLPGGYVAAEWFHPDQVRAGYRSGGPPREDMMLTPGELLTAFAGWEIFSAERVELDLDEGAVHRGPAVVTRFAARKPQ